MSSELLPRGIWILEQNLFSNQIGHFVEVKWKASYQKSISFKLNPVPGRRGLLRVERGLRVWDLPPRVLQGHLLHGLDQREHRHPHRALIWLNIISFLRFGIRQQNTKLNPQRASVRLYEFQMFRLSCTISCWCDFTWFLDLMPWLFSQVVLFKALKKSKVARSMRTTCEKNAVFIWLDNWKWVHTGLG